MALPLVLILLPGLAILAWYAAVSARAFHVEQVEGQLESLVRVVTDALPQPATQANAARVDEYCKQAGARAGMRFTVIHPSGEVLGDSDEEPSRMDNHANRPEVRAAMAGAVGRAVRFSTTERMDFIYVAVPHMEGQHVTLIVRAGAPLAEAYSQLNAFRLRVVVASAIVAAFLLAASLAAAHRFTRPLRIMQQEAQRYAQGDFSRRVPIPDTEELAELATAFNLMAAQLQDRIQSMNRQRRELDAVLASMVEGVIAVTPQERILRMNPAAAALFGLTPEQARGRDIQEVIRTPRLHECLARAIKTESVVEDDIILLGGPERHLHIWATLLRDDAGASMGALLVLADVTELRRLERARSDFMANVSHEIKTPITSIKGYTETLLEGAFEEPVVARRFLEIIGRQADRLCALTDDILSLSSLERHEFATDTPLRAIPVRDTIDAAVHACAPKAEAKNVALAVVCPPGLVACADPPLLEQALINLIDNAVKYSEPDREVTITAVKHETGVAISVRDRGCGIAAEYLPRVFERFFRVDRARSRKLGGTGLGLAIVKHIMALHGGAVAVESTLGEGSCFTLNLPDAPPDQGGGEPPAGA